MKGAAKTATKKPNIFKRMAKGIKEIISELKKVTWPTVAKVFAETGVVLVVVLFFLLVILGFDSLLAFFYRMLVRR